MPKEGPKGPKGPTRRFNRQLAQVFRDKVPAEIIAEFWLAILQGHADAYLAEDERTEHGWRVDWPRDGRGSTSTPEQKAHAMTVIQYGAFGTPVQSIALQAHITRDDDGKTALPPGEYSPTVLDAIARAMRGELPALTSTIDTIDAEFTETSAPAETTADTRDRDKDHDPDPDDE